MPRTKEEARAYQQGYATGRKRAAYDYDRELASEEREEFRRQAALVTLNAMTRPGNNWGTTKDGVYTKYKTMEDFAEAAFTFADKLVRRTSFTGRRLKAPAIEAQRATTENTGVVEDESAAPKAGARK
jgi:hypothetical protein